MTNINMHAAKMDLHIHTCWSRDAFITIEQLERFFKKNPDFVVGITDHNEIKGALAAKRILGERIIVGEEIKTAEGEIIGLYLDRFIEPGMTLEDTVEEIRSQRGLVMVPHPFKRTGNSDSPVREDSLYGYIEHFDMIEIFSARNRTMGANENALSLAKTHKKPKAVGTDAHAVYELGRAYVTVPCYEGKDTILKQLQSGVPLCQPIRSFHRILTRAHREVRRVFN